MHCSSVNIKLHWNCTSVPRAATQHTWVAEESTELKGKPDSMLSSLRLSLMHLRTHFMNGKYLLIARWRPNVCKNGRKQNIIKQFKFIPVCATYFKKTKQCAGIHTSTHTCTTLYLLKITVNYFMNNWDYATRYKAKAPGPASLAMAGRYFW